MIDIIKILISPAVLLYLAVIRIRNWFFDQHFFSSVRVNIKVISIGNITVGGSGKTPAVINIINTLKRHGIRVGLLSRGYRRSTKGYLLVYNGQDSIKPVKECGDEMYLVTDECKIPSAVSERRVEGARRFLKDADIEAIVLDDAFQHRWLHRDLDILMFDQRFLTRRKNLDKNLLPLGLMREPFSAVKRADLIIINRKFSEKKELSSNVKRWLEGKKVYYGYYEATGIYDVKSHQYYDLEEFKGQKSLVVCGIARPYSFLKILESNNINVSNKLIFPDHKNYSSKEVQEIRKKFYDTNSYSVLTTQKDAVKLTNFSKELDDIDIYYLKIDLNLEEKDLFEQELLKLFNKQDIKIN